MPITVAKAKMLVAWPDGNEAQSAIEGEGFEIERADRVEQLRPRPADDVLGEIGNQARPANADKDEADGAGDQAIGGRVPEADVALPQDERDGDRRAGRNQHPVRFADIGDRAEEFARLGHQRLRPLEHEGIDDEKPEKDDRQREHDLLDDGEVLQARKHGLSSRQDRAVLRRQCQAGQVAVAEPASRLPSQMK